MLTELVITDSIAPPEAVAAASKIRLLTIAPLLAEAIKRIARQAMAYERFNEALAKRTLEMVPRDGIEPPTP